MIRAGRSASCTLSSTASKDTSPGREGALMRRTLTPPPSAAAILEGLHQGNALELQTFEAIKEGLVSLISGLQDEGRNRGDALDELTENFGVMSLDLSTAQKTKLAGLIKEGITECKKEKKASSKAAGKKHNRINNTLDDNLRMHDDASDIIDVRSRSLNRIYDMSNDLSRTRVSPRVDDICKGLWREYDINSQAHRDDVAISRRTRDMLYDQALLDKRDNNKNDKYVAKHVEKTTRTFWRIAKALGVEEDIDWRD